MFSNCVVHDIQKARMNSVPLGESPIRSDYNSDKIHLFYEQQKVDFPYVEIKQIEIEGGKGMPDHIILDYVRNEVYNSQGNAFINITKESRNYINYDNAHRSYATNVYKGLIVYAESLKTKWLIGEPSPYTKSIENHFDEIEGSNGAIFVLSTITSILCILAGSLED